MMALVNANVIILNWCCCVIIVHSFSRIRPFDQQKLLRIENNTNEPLIVAFKVQGFLSYSDFQVEMNEMKQKASPFI